MNHSSLSSPALLVRSVCILVVSLLVTNGFGERTLAQGLSGTPQRLEETLGRAEPPKSGAGPSQSSGPRTGSRPPSGGNSDEEMMDGMDMMDDMEDMDMDDMDMEMEMGMGMGGYGGRSSSARGSQSDAMQTYASSLISVMGGVDLSPLFSPTQGIAVEGGPFLRREAEQAFKAGNHAVALELMFGHMATEYEDASDILRNVKYSELLRRPVWNIRWGISMSVRGDAGATDPSPIREGATPIGQRFAGRGGQGDGDDYDSEMMEDMDEMDEMEDMEEMDEMDDMDMEMEMEMGGRSGGNGRGRTARGPIVPAIPVREMLSAATAETLDKTLGLVAKVAGEEFTKRFQNGDFGPVLTNVSAPEPVASVRGGTGRPSTVPAGASMSAALNDTLSEADDPLPMWKPGIVYLGEGTADEIIPAARAANIDVVLHFDVILKPGPSETVRNISRCRVLHVSAGKSVISSKGIDSFEAVKLASAGRAGERDYVTEQMQALFALIDGKIKVIDLQRLSPAVARSRIASLIDSPNARSLRTLAEIRLFQAQGLIDQAEVEAAFDIIGGVDALMLLHGPLDGRVAMARSWSIASQGTGRE